MLRGSTQAQQTNRAIMAAVHAALEANGFSADCIVDFDPTNNCLVDDSYITIAWGRDYEDVCPIQGVFVGTGEHRIGVSVDVAPV